MKGTAEEKWASRIAAWETSGKSQREFAAEQRYSLSTFRWWSSRIRTKKARKAAEITPKISMARVIRIPPRRESDASLVVELAPKYWAATRARLDPVALARPVGEIVVPAATAP